MRIKRYLVDETYPVLMDRGIVKPEGPHKGIIEFFCGLANASPGNEFHQSMHEAFVAGREFSHDAGVFFFTPVDPIADFDEYKVDPQFLKALQVHPTAPLWHAAINGVWDGFEATFIRKSSLNKILRFASGDDAQRIEGIRELSEDEWDLRYGWAKSTGLLPSRMREFERIAGDREALLEAWRSDGLEYDSVYNQIRETASAELRDALRTLDEAGLV